MAYPGTDELVAAAEAKLGRRLPEAHRSRLIRENGGEISVGRDPWTLYPVWDPSNRKTMSRTANHILRENEALRRDRGGTLPEGLIAVADNGSGDLLVLTPGEDNVRFWNHETGDIAAVDVAWE